VYFPKKLSPLQRFRRDLCEAQNWRCCYCKLQVTLYCKTTAARDAATIEHLIPRAKGGKETKENKVIACQHCNHLRNVYHPYLFERVVLWLLETPEIKTAWHKFNQKQTELLNKIILKAIINQNKGDTSDPPNVRPLLKSLRATSVRGQKERS
jgi:hypothetical protein